MFQVATVYLFKSLIYSYVENNVIYVADSTYCIYILNHPKLKLL